MATYQPVQDFFHQQYLTSNYTPVIQHSWLENGGPRIEDIFPK